jgi:hypothetical protein
MERQWIGTHSYQLPFSQRDVTSHLLQGIGKPHSGHHSTDNEVTSRLHHPSESSLICAINGSRAEIIFEDKLSTLS